MKNHVVAVENPETFSVGLVADLQDEGVETADGEDLQARVGGEDEEVDVDFEAELEGEG